MFYLRRMYLLLVVLGIVIALSAGTSIAQTPEGEEPLGEEARVVDAQWYASHYGVNLEEALRRFQLQDDTVDLQPALIKQEADAFAGLWIQHEPEFRIVVAFTRDGEETIKPYIEDKPWADAIEVRAAGATLVELEAAQGAAHRILRELDIPADSLIDVTENHVELRVTDQAQLDAALQKAGIRLPDHVVVVQVSKLATAATDIFGGKALSWCTSGFSVVDAYGVKGITTAGHCPNVGITFEGINLPWKNGIYGYNWDIQWHKADHAFTVRNLVWDGTWNRYIFSTKHRSSQRAGETVCKYGKTTKGSCGTIITTSFRPLGGDAPPNATATYILVADGGAGGDSGGPVFWGNTAYGTMVATTADNEYCYMAVNYITNLGVTVLTN